MDQANHLHDLTRSMVETFVDPASTWELDRTSPDVAVLRVRGRKLAIEIELADTPFGLQASTWVLGPLEPPDPMQRHIQYRFGEVVSFMHSPVRCEATTIGLDDELIYCAYGLGHEGVHLGTSAEHGNYMWR